MSKLYILIFFLVREITIVVHRFDELPMYLPIVAYTDFLRFYTVFPSISVNNRVSKKRILNLFHFILFLT